MNAVPAWNGPRQPQNGSTNDRRREAINRHFTPTVPAARGPSRGARNQFPGSTISQGIVSSTETVVFMVAIYPCPVRVFTEKSRVPLTQLFL
jgi:hypothetical protein